MTSRIVVGVDGSAGSAEALAWAVTEARLWHANVEAVYAWVYKYGGDCIVPPLVSMEQADRMERSLLDHAVDAVSDGVEDVIITRRACPGGAPSTLIEAGRDAELLVVGSRGRGGFASLLLGSVSHQVLSHAPCPVVVIPGETSNRVRQHRMVVGVDGSAGADAALRWAIDEAHRRNAELEVFNVWSFPMTAYVPGTEAAKVTIGGMEHAAFELVEAAVAGTDRKGVQVRRRVREGSVAEVLTKAAEDADLLVVGSRGRGGFAGLLLGSSSYQCASHSPCPVVVVPVA